MNSGVRRCRFPPSSDECAIPVREIWHEPAKVATYMLDTGEEVLERELGQWKVKGSPMKLDGTRDCTFTAYTSHPEGLEPGIIDSMTVQGQTHAGMTQGPGPALYDEIPFDEDGNNLAGSCMDYLVPTAVETPAWETAHTVTPSPHHRLGAKGVGESATVGAAPGVANAVVDALAHLGVAHMDIPIRPDRLREVLKEKRVGG